MLPGGSRLLFRDYSGLFFILPALVLFAFFYLYPFWELFFLSLHEWPGVGPRVFVGLDNFRLLAGDGIWWRSFIHAGYITLIALTLQNILAFTLALACDREIRMRRFYALVFFIPPILSEVVAGMLWSWILNASSDAGRPVGLLNYFLYSSGFPHLVRHWLADPDTALTCVAAVHVWKSFGWGFLIFLAGLQMIDRQLYEQARVDGGSAWQAFWHITLPLMAPVVGLVMLLTVLGSMQVFVLMFSLVGQGVVYHTEVPVTRIFASMQGTGQFGYACAQAVVLGVILLFSSFGLRKIMEKLLGPERRL